MQFNRPTVHLYFDIALVPKFRGAQDHLLS